MAKTKETRGRESTALKRDQPESRRDEPRTQSMQTRRGGEMQQPYSPFAFMRRFNEEMDRLFQNFAFGRGLRETSLGRQLGFLGEGGPTVWSPQIEVFQRGDDLVIQADLPGMTKDDVTVDISGDAIVVRGERRSEHEEEDEGYYRSERSYGSFYRTIPLPEGVDAENAEANFRNGVLEITMPAPERAERRRIEIREAEEQRPKAQAKAAGQR